MNRRKTRRRSLHKVLKEKVRLGSYQVLTLNPQVIFYYLVIEKTKGEDTSRQASFSRRLFTNYK
jgi:hypothetical protein